jgi:hypothetical protein
MEQNGFEGFLEIDYLDLFDHARRSTNFAGTYEYSYNAGSYYHNVLLLLEYKWISSRGVSRQIHAATVDPEAGHATVLSF